MLDAFLATLTPMLTMFICIAVGFTIRKTDVVPKDSGKVLSKLVTWVFCPALNFSTMSRNCTVQTLENHATNIILAALSVFIAMLIAIPLSRLFVREKSAERGIYAYALAFANSGYMGDPVIQMVFGDEALAYYKFFCIPVSIAIYSWGMTQLVPKGAEKKSFIKSFFNAPMIATILGIICGLTGLGAQLQNVAFITKSLDTLKVCMGPSAMLVAGFTIANYSLSSMFKKPKVYIASILRLTVLPAIIIGSIFGLKTLANALFGLDISNDVLYLSFFAVATPLGLNTVVFPEAYGGNPETGASMTMISHTMCVITIPIMFALMTIIFGASSLG